MNIVAVCSCPSGVAHTYMACEGLECAAKKRKASIKVETQVQWESKMQSPRRR